MKSIFVLLSILLLSALSLTAQQTTAFSYQGRLNNSAITANGTYDFRFELYDASIGGTPIATVTSSGIQVTGGIFTVQLDFGANAFNGNDRYLEIAVKLPSDSTYTALTPRQKLTSVPYAVKSIAADTATVAQTANNATSLGGITAANYLLNTGDASQLTNVGGAVRWNVITANQQASSNNGYFVNSSQSLAEISVNLPTNPQIGDIVRISGNTDWALTLNPQQFVSRDLTPTPATAWVNRAVVGSLTTVTCSVDGKNLVGSFTDSNIRTSTDAGLTWVTRTTLPSVLGGLASSSDGTKIVGVAFGGRIFTSADSGVTWTQRESIRQWSGVASSADGTKLAATVFGGQIYTSVDSGVTWTPRETARNWYSVASSADGTKLAATSSGGQIYTSTDSGVTWVPRETNRNWAEISSNADGTRLIAIQELVTGSAAGIYLSTDSGVTWAFKSFGLNAGSSRGHSGFNRMVAVSSTGKDIVVASASTMTVGAANSTVIFSSDFGQTWSIGNVSAPNQSVISSSDFRFLFGISPSNIPVIFPRIENTKFGAQGGVSGSSGGYVELLYTGNGEFTIVNSKGYIRLR